MGKYWEGTGKTPVQALSDDLRQVRQLERALQRQIDRLEKWNAALKRVSPLSPSLVLGQIVPTGIGVAVGLGVSALWPEYGVGVFAIGFMGSIGATFVGAFVARKGVQGSALKLVAECMKLQARQQNIQRAIFQRKNEEEEARKQGRQKSFVRRVSHQGRLFDGAEERKKKR